MLTKVSTVTKIRNIFFVCHQIYILCNNFFFFFVIVEPNLGEDLRVVMLSSERQWRSMYPYLVAGLVAWPAFWLYRGYEWHKVRAVEPLPLYIRKVVQDEQTQTEN